MVENWQSEYLQFFLYVFATVWLVQRGSPESKEPHQSARSPTRSNGSVRTPRRTRRPGCGPAAGGRALLPVAGVRDGRDLPALLGRQSVAGWAAYNAEQLDQHEDPVSWLGYLGRADFWNRTFQNWQSEFLAVGSMAVSRSTCANAAPRSPSRSARRTATRATPAEQRLRG